MDWKDVGNSITDLAPKLGGLFGLPGAAIGGAVGALGRLFGFGDKEPKPEELMAAIKADPQAALKLRLAEMDFVLQQREQDIKEFQVQLADVQSARSREVEIKKAGGSNLFMYLLGVVICLGFFSLLAMLIFRDLPPGSSDVVKMLLTQLATAFLAIVYYFYGTSKSSYDKTHLMANGMKK